MGQDYCKGHANINGIVIATADIIPKTMAQLLHSESMLIDQMPRCYERSLHIPPME
jgi:hypothetical protein